MSKFYSMKNIIRRNKRAGGEFFARDTMRFFRSHCEEVTYCAQGGVYFVTSEQFEDDSPRGYTVRKFNPENARIDTVSEFNKLTRPMAHKLARQYSTNGVPEVSEDA